MLVPGSDLFRRGPATTTTITSDWTCRLSSGSAGGSLRTGLFLDYRTDFERGRWTKYIGTAYNRLLVTCMLAMGMTPDQWEVDGPGYGSFAGSKYDKTPLDQVVGGDRSGMREMLPRLAV